MPQSMRYLQTSEGSTYILSHIISYERILTTFEIIIRAALKE